MFFKKGIVVLIVIATLPSFLNAFIFPRESSRRISSYPFISGDTFRKFCNHIFDETDTPFIAKNVMQADTIFINGEILEDGVDVLQKFFTEQHPQIQHKYILITHNTDRSLPGKFGDYLNDEKIIAWFSQNIDRKHHKLFGIPIGLANYHWPHGKIEIVKNALQNIPATEHRTPRLVYLNFAIWTNPHIRAPIWDFFKSKPFCVPTSGKAYPEYLNDLKKYRFVISPPGNGLDCHRNWEALLMGCIPILKHSTIDELFENLPVIFIHDWNEVTEEFLEKKHLEMKNTKYDLRKLYAEYWFNKITTIQNMYH